jgi:hypothetical protein
VRDGHFPNPSRWVWRAPGRNGGLFASVAARKLDMLNGAGWVDGMRWARACATPCPTQTERAIGLCCVYRAIWESASSRLGASP